MNNTSRRQLLRHSVNALPAYLLSGCTATNQSIDESAYAGYSIQNGQGWMRSSIFCVVPSSDVASPLVTTLDEWMRTNNRSNVGLVYSGTQTIARNSQGSVHLNDLKTGILETRVNYTRLSPGRFSVSEERTLNGQTVSAPNPNAETLSESMGADRDLRGPWLFYMPTIGDSKQGPVPGRSYSSPTEFGIGLPLIPFQKSLSTEDTLYQWKMRPAGSRFIGAMGKTCAVWNYSELTRSNSTGVQVNTITRATLSDDVPGRLVDYRSELLYSYRPNSVSKGSLTSIF